MSLPIRGSAELLARQWYQEQLPNGLEQAISAGNDAQVNRQYETSSTPERVADWVQALSSHDCWAQEFTQPGGKGVWVHRHFYQVALVPLVVPPEYTPHALTYSRFMPVRNLLTQRTTQWVDDRHLITWMGVSMDYASLCNYRPSGWKALLEKLRVCLGPLKHEDGWPGLTNFGLPADAPRLWFMVGAIVNQRGWLTKVSLVKKRDASVRSDIAKALGFCLDEPAPDVAVGELALVRTALPAGLCAWFEALNRWHALRGWTLEPGPQDFVLLHLHFCSTQDGMVPRPDGEVDANAAALISEPGAGRPAWRSCILLRRLHFDQIGWESLLATLAQWPHLPDAPSLASWESSR